MKKNNRIPLGPEERNRRRRDLILIAVTVLFIICFSFIEHSLFHEEYLLPESNNILIFGLININIILIILLIFLIIRNVVKLVFERRQGVVGSKMRTKLVAAFVCLSLIPTILLFLVAGNFLSFSIDNWFNVRVGDALNKTLEVAQIYYRQYEENAKYHAGQLSADIMENQLNEGERVDYLKTLVQQRQKQIKASVVEIYLDDRTKGMVFLGPEQGDIKPLSPTPQVMEEVFTGNEVSIIQPSENGEFISGLVPIYSNAHPSEVIGAVVVSYFVPREIVDKISIVSKASEQYGQLHLMQNPIKISYMITLAIITLLIIFSATWFGLFMAKGITVPILDLADATKRIAKGDWSRQIDIVAGDEIGVLVDSFNSMTRDLKESKENLEQANMNLEQRRKYMETVLHNVSAGVISVDEKGFITTINGAAGRMLDIKLERVINRRYEDILLSEHLALAEVLLKDLEKSPKGQIERQLELMLKERALTILMTLTLVRDDEGHEMGMVIVFEDLTQLQQAERAAAWREVARRMAHEIKNPLTPIQLSAQRLQRKYGEQLGDQGGIFYECTRTIIDQVELLKNLVNEFSRYARMPVTRPAPGNLNETLTDAVTLYQDAHKDILFEFELSEEMPKVILDSEQIKRVMTNLLDNAVAAVNKSEGTIKIRTIYDRGKNLAVTEVADNGCGVPSGYKMKVFEPYFSMKKSGTGLGLAIVSSIISDHHGHITISNNEPRGTVVTFDLPVAAETVM
ncbi:MAG: Sensor protein kinase WalK [Syntrophus sp. PtaU1.Bin208]|nr:MAG: Sensor protein kinase WalK [Syntrophus sp. PtaU1.Bin208]